MRSIGYGAFENCTDLTSVTIPDSVKSIGKHAFYNCESLISITIPDSVTSIGGSAFEGCSGLTSVTIPDSVTTLSSYAFYECRNLASVIIGNGITTIGSFAFNRCGLTSLTIPDSVTNIDAWAFCGCRNLTSITIPDSVTTIGDDAFYFTSIKDVYYKGSEQDRAKMHIANGNSSFLNATWHYNGDTTDPAVIEIDVTIPDYQKGGTVMAALYDESDTLIGIKSYPPAETVKVSFEQSGAYIKVLQWDMTTMKPLAPPQNIKVN